MRFLPMVVLPLVSAFSGSAHAKDMKAAVARDIVELRDGKMKVERYQVCEVKVPNPKKSSVQLRTYAEALADGTVSRDFFVTFQATMSTLMMIGVGKEMAGKSGIDAMNALDCENIDAPIGEADYEFNFYMTGNGFQLEIVDNTTGETVRESKAWSQM